MPSLHNYQREDYASLLAASEIDASKGTLFQNGAKLNPNTTHRTILIGLGGTGIQTIDYVKGVLTNRLNPNWTSYVGFLGVDTDYTELGAAGYLTKADTVTTTKPQANERKKDPSKYPQAWRRFANPIVMSKVPDMNTTGANRKRLVGRLKIHDQDGTSACDMEIVQKLAYLKNNTLAPIAPGTVGNYEVYVIGSVSGGTGSGGFLEMPALIKQALNVSNVQIYAMMYLPDTLTGLDPANADALKANGYASLKELNYFQGMSMRPGYTEKWGYNNLASPELELVDDFYTLPYLIGTPSGGTADSNIRAKQKIAEFMISIVTKVNTTGNNTQFLTDQFVCNAIAKKSDRELTPGATERENTGAFHEFPRHYAAIGFAQIAAPKKIVRSYIVGQACEKAGLQPVSLEKYEEMKANGTAILPFRSEEQPMNATVGSTIAKEILKPVENILNVIHSAKFEFLATPGWTGDGLFDRLYNQEFNSPIEKKKLEDKYNDEIGTVSMGRLEEVIKNALNAVRTNIHNFVRQEGPVAFYMLYHGKFTEVNGSYGTGISALLNNLKAGKNFAGNPVGYPSPVACQQALDNAFNYLRSQKKLLGKKTQSAQSWVVAYDNWRKAQIIEARRGHALGDNGKLNELLIAPLALLAEQLRSFGYVLAAMSDIYSRHGNCMDDYQEFRKAKDNKTEINLAAVSPNSHQWLLSQAKRELDNVNALGLRQALVDDFFEGNNRAEWLNVPEDSIETKDGHTRLKANAAAVPARARFDSIMQKEVPNTLSLTIQTTFQAIANGQSYDDFAAQVIQQLVADSGIMFNGPVEAGLYHRYLMYPASLKTTTDGVQIATALTNAINNFFPATAGTIAIYESDDTDSIKLYQMAAPFEIYRLKELPEWERQYFAHYEELLHGMSQDVVSHQVPGQAATYTEKTTWKDYPSIVGAVDPKIPDSATGEVSYEGERRKELAKFIARAKELGVLYSKKDNAGWRVYRVNCDKSVVEWNLDISVMETNAIGLLPTGGALANAVALQNGKASLAEISKPVELAEQGANGVFGKPHAEEKFAWQWVERVLRVHVPMQIEVRDTLEKFEKWYKVIKEYNDTVLERLKPAKLVFIIRSRILNNVNGLWKIKLSNGTEKNVAKLDEAGVKMLSMTNPKAARMVKGGFSAYYLYTALTKLADIDECYTRAREALNEMASYGEEDEIMAGINMSQFIMDEAEALVELGAEFDKAEDGEPRERVLNAMKNKGVDDSAAVKEIIKFYSRAVQWENL